MAHASRTQRKPRPPLDADEAQRAGAGLCRPVRDHAAPSCATYLQRKVRERGWDGGRRPPTSTAIAERFAAQGYVDDAAYALSKSRSLTGRGYGARRVEQSLRTAGVDEEDAAAGARACAGRIASRPRCASPSAAGSGRSRARPADRKARERALAAMIRAGHGFGLARAIVDLPPGAEIDVEAAWPTMSG